MEMQFDIATLPIKDKNTGNMSTSNKGRGIQAFYVKLVPLDPLMKTLELFR